MTVAHNQRGPSVELQRSLPSEVAAISPFVDRLMFLFGKSGCVSEGESGVEIALREVLANAIIHGNHENPGKHLSPTGVGQLAGLPSFWVCIALKPCHSCVSKGTFGPPGTKLTKSRLHSQPGQRVKW
jgi:hypothetical protein